MMKRSYTNSIIKHSIIKYFYSKFLLRISDCQIQSLSHCEDILWSVRGTSLKWEEKRRSNQHKYGQKNNTKGCSEIGSKNKKQATKLQLEKISYCTYEGRNPK